MLSPGLLARVVELHSRFGYGIYGGGLYRFVRITALTGISQVFRRG